MWAGDRKNFLDQLEENGKLKLINNLEKLLLYLDDKLQMTGKPMAEDVLASNENRLNQLFMKSSCKKPNM